MVALVGLTLGLPLMLLEAILIRFDSPGPALFWHIRPGHSAIGSKEGAAIIVAHEMIHHWEETIVTEFEETSYPAEINKIIAQWYGDTVGGKRWRAAHSDRFIAKAYAVAGDKGWDIARLLTGKKYYDWLEP